MNMKRNISLLAIASITMAGGVWAGTDTVNMNVETTIAKECVVGTPTTMSFGTLALLDAASGEVVTTGNDDAVGTFSTACTNGATLVTFAFTGEGASGFEMDDDTDGTNVIAYTLFSDSGRTASITRAADEASADFSGFAADGANHVLSVYGRIALVDMVAKPVDTYADIVTVTVTYAD